MVLRFRTEKYNFRNQYDFLGVSRTRDTFRCWISTKYCCSKWRRMNFQPRITILPKFDCKILVEQNVRNGILNSFGKSALSLHQYERLFWSKNMQNSARIQCFSSTKINNREGDGRKNTKYKIVVDSTFNEVQYSSKKQEPTIGGMSCGFFQNSHMTCGKLNNHYFRKVSQFLKWYWSKKMTRYFRKRFEKSEAYNWWIYTSDYFMM